MTHTLVISDNEILNQLYVTNLEVYLGTKVTLVDSVAKAISLFTQKKFDLIVSINMINGQESAAEVYEHLKKSKLDSQLVVIGKPNKELDHAIVVQSSYQLQNLIRSCAQVLGVTAKEMTEKVLAEYYSVADYLLLRVQETPCSIYMQMKNGVYTLVAKKGDMISGVIKKFSAEGIEIFYVNSLDRLLIVNCISASICDYLQAMEAAEGTTNAEKSEGLKAGFSFAASTFSQSPGVAAEIVNVANACTKVMESIVNDSPNIKKLLAVLTDERDGYIYTHSILAAYVSNHIIKRVSWGGESHIEKINFVLFFHDIMLAPIYQKYPQISNEEDLIFNDFLSEKEKEIILNHARLAAELIVSFKRAPIGADVLIKQHHGIVNGIGFAQEYKDDVSPLSKIVLVAEAFVQEFLKIRMENPNGKINIKKMMDFLNEKFKKSTYKKIIETLKDFPL